MKKLQFILPVLLFGACTSAWPANFNMTCTAANSTLPFNAYDVLGGTAATTPTGTITVTCTTTSTTAVTVSYSLTLATTPARKLTSASNSLTYDLYTDAAFSIQWGTAGTCTAGSNTNAGNRICGSFSVPARGSASQSKTYYGKVPGGSDVPTGTYSQTGLVVTLTYSCNPAPTGAGTC